MNKLLILLFLSFIIVSCHFTGTRIEGNGHIISEKRAANNISKIQLAGGINVVIDNGLAGIRIEGDENIIPYIITETDNDMLKIKTKNNISINSAKPVTIYVSTPAIYEINVTGNGDVTANGKFSTNDKMKFEIAGSGNITIDVNAPEIEASVTGSGSLHISGETKNTKVSIAGSGNYDGINLKAENADVEVAGSGTALVFADVNLKTSIAGSGDIKYKGNAAVDKHVAGSGEVIKLQ